MRRFHSYGPVDCRYHFCIERRVLVEQCIHQLIGIPEEGGHYFTIWSSRQAGKTWLMQQAKQGIAQRYGEQFALFDFSLGNLRGMNPISSANSDSTELPQELVSVLRLALPGRPTIKTWEDFALLFAREGGLWDRPLILLIDEVDTAHPSC